MEKIKNDERNETFRSKKKNTRLNWKKNSVGLQHTPSKAKTSLIHMKNFTWRKFEFQKKYLLLFLGEIAVGNLKISQTGDKEKRAK